jgi:P-type Cu2+ transporter
MIKKEVYPVTGMACAACAGSVESMLASLSGVQSAVVNYAGSNVYVVFDDALVFPQDLVKSAESIGYGLIIEQENLTEKLQGIEEGNFRKLKQRLIVAALFSLPVFVLSMVHAFHFTYMNWLLMLLSLPVLLYSGAEFYIHAWKQARNRLVNMDTLVALSTGFAFAFSIVNTVIPSILLQAGLSPHVYYESAVVIITFILAGKFLEERSKSKASAVIRGLMGLQPKTLTVIRDGNEMELPLLMVTPGDKVTVRPGDRIPVDGLIQTGESYIDESSITGEPLPVLKSPGEAVYAGTLNQNGNLILTATKAGKNTLLAGIIALIQEAQSAKPPIQKLADRISSVFVPVVLALASLTFLIWWLAGPSPSLTFAFLTTISVLIIACPCALGLATPAALITGIGRGASSGILVRNAHNLETACKIDSVVFDKTGTLTCGTPSVVENTWFTEDEQSKVLLFSLEKKSAHPLAKAVSTYLGDLQPLPLDTFSEIPGMGVRAEFNGKILMAGNRRFMDESGISISDEISGENSVYYSTAGLLAAVFRIDDPVRESAAAAVASLRAEGIEVFMLTGDRTETAARIAAETGIVRYTAGVLPSEKNLFIRELRKQGRRVAMVGDGINDSAAMAEADLGIAMSTGSDIAIDSAGIILMQGDLRSVVKAIRLSRHTVRIIRQNFFWAFFYNIIAIPVAAGVLYPFTGFLLSPMIAGAAMAMSSVTVVLNSLRLKSVNLD